MDKAALSAASGAAAVCPLDPGWAERRADPASGHSLQQYWVPKEPMINSTMVVVIVLPLKNC